MATNEPNKPDDVKIDPGNETLIDEKSAPDNQPLQDNGEIPAPELTAEETAATLSNEGEAVSQEMGEPIPDPGDVVVPFEKIEEIMTKRKAAAVEAEKQAVVPDKAARRERPPKAEKADKPPKAEKSAGPKQAAKENPPVPEAAPPVEPEQPQEPKEAPRPGEAEQIVYLNLGELHAFKNHPFQVRDDADMKAMVESVKEGGVNQPAIVRQRPEGGYEIISGHRRQKASELAGYADMPCIIRNLSDDEAVLKMAEDNINQRKEILPSERAKMLKMQLEAIKHQGARDASGQLDPKEAGMRSNEIVADRNSMTVKQVQRYIRLDVLVPDLVKMVDEKKIAFTPAVEMSYIKPKNQRYIAVAIEGQQSAPSLSQAQRMRELDQKGMLNGDVIDGVLLEEKKEVDKVILNSQELSQYFGKDKTPREMKDQIIKLLDDWKGQQKDLAKPEKNAEQEK